MGNSSKVDELITEKKHPLTKEIELIRLIILETDDRIEETIKWSSPTFMYKGNIASFFMNAKRFVSLMFHKGAMIDDPFKLLEGDGKETRVARFQNLEDVKKKEIALRAVILEWIKLMDNKSN